MKKVCLTIGIILLIGLLPISAAIAQPEGIEGYRMGRGIQKGDFRDNAEPGVGMLLKLKEKEWWEAQV